MWLRLSGEDVIEMPKSFQARVIYQSMNERGSELPPEMYQWICSMDDDTKFERWYMSYIVRSCLLYQFPILMRRATGLVPWAHDDEIMVMNLQEMWAEMEENDRPQPMQSGVIG